MVFQIQGMVLHNFFSGLSYFCLLLQHISLCLFRLHRFFALKYSSDAVCTVLRVDQIIMAKPAGGPRRDAQPGGGMDED